MPDQQPSAPPLNIPLRTVAHSLFASSLHACEMSVTEVVGPFEGRLFGTVEFAPLCRHYRKADGNKLAKHLKNRPRPARSQLPLDSLDDSYPDFDPTGANHPHRTLCRECVAVFTHGGTGQLATPSTEQLTQELTTLRESSSSSSSPGAELTESLRPLTASQRSALKQIVVSDFATLTADLQVQYQRHTEAKNKELQELFGGGEPERRALLQKFQQHQERVQEEQRLLIKEMKDAGFQAHGTQYGLNGFSVAVPNQLKPAEYDRAVQKAREDAERMYRLALSVAEAEKSRLLRLILLSAVDGGVAQGLVDMIPSAEKVFAEAMSSTTNTQEGSE